MQRILLARMPPLLFDILRQLVASEPDMKVVGSFEDGDLLATAKRTRADVVLVASESANDSEQHEQLLLRQRRFKVLAIADNGKTGSLYELHPHKTPLGELSADSLREAIRGGPLPATSKPTAVDPTQPME